MKNVENRVCRFCIRNHLQRSAEFLHFFKEVIMSVECMLMCSCHAMSTNACSWLRLLFYSFISNVISSMGFSGTPKDMGPPYGKRDPYHSHFRIPEDMGMVWE